MGMAELMFWLLVGHAVCDFPLQGDFLARGKDHTRPLPGVPWEVCLLAHGLIHGGAVALVTGSPVLGMAECWAHCWIDWGKSQGGYGFWLDQALHVAVKLVWAGTANLQ